MTIPLSAVAKLVPTVGPLQINHQGQQPAVTISFNLAPGISLGYAVDKITELEQSSNLPATIATGFSGTAQVFQDSLRGQGVLILAAVFAAFVILGILYESFIHPITIISGLPSAGIGAILTLMLFGMEMSVIAMIGIVMLVGIVKKNAIMMVDFALERRRVGLSAEHAIREAALLRFRPIMMTTFAAIFGTLPIALGAGAGAELRQPLGIAVVGGLCLSQLLTLYITPVIYIYLDRIDRRLKRKLEPQLDETARASGRTWSPPNDGVRARDAVGCAACVAVLIALAFIAGPARADEPIEIFDAHLHYNWEPKPYYSVDEVLALFKKHRVTGILATSRPNTGTHALMDAKPAGPAGRALHPALSRARRHPDLVRRSLHLRPRAGRIQTRLLPRHRRIPHLGQGGRRRVGQEDRRFRRCQRSLSARPCR